MKKLFIFVLFLTVMMFINGCTKHQDTDKISQNNSINKTIEAESLEKLLDWFNEIYKRLLISTGQGKTFESRQAVVEAKNRWEIIMSENVDFSSFPNTPSIPSKLAEIEAIISESENFIQKNQLEKAHESLETIRVKLMELRLENGIKNISDDMLLFHNSMEKLVESKVKDELLIKELEALIIPFKNYNTNNPDYKLLLENLSNILTDLKNKNGKAYSKLLETLKPAFIQIYLQFG